MWTDRPLYGERIVHMGWQPAGDGSFVRRLTASDDVDRVFANFQRHLEVMVLQNARLIEIPWEHALETFVTRVEGTELDWWLYGSGALAVRGLAVVPGDLDFAVNDAQLVGRLFGDLLVEPVTYLADWVAPWIGRAFDRALFEWQACAHPTGRYEPTEQEPAVRDRLEIVYWRGHEVLVPPLAIQLTKAVERGLQDRAALIRLALAR